MKASKRKVGNRVTVKKPLKDNTKLTIVLASLDLLYADPEAFDRYFSITQKESEAQVNGYDIIE